MISRLGTAGRRRCLRWHDQRCRPLLIPPEPNMAGNCVLLEVVTDAEAIAHTATLTELRG
ncbi:MAG TPA: hypothetical protein DG414_09630 [Gammaproteobacteria bacterium]|nr:hypothetical protein [Gammaproteobacteria bacterium]